MFIFAVWVRKYWGAFAFVIGTALALAALKGSYFDPGGYDWAFRFLFVLALVLLVVLLGAFVSKPVLSWVDTDKSLVVRYAKRNELDEFLPFYQSVIGGPLPPMNEIKRTLKANSEIIRLLERVKRGPGKESRRLVGFCSVLPITRSAVTLFEREELDGLKLTRAHVCTPRESPAAIYIGSIGAKGAEARAAILSYALGVMHDQASHGVRYVYTRPTTREGLRVAKQYGFMPVASNVDRNALGRVYKLANKGRYRRRDPHAGTEGVGTIKA